MSLLIFLIAAVIVIALLGLLHSNGKDDKAWALLAVGIVLLAMGGGTRDVAGSFRNLALSWSWLETIALLAIVVLLVVLQNRKKAPPAT